MNHARIKQIRECAEKAGAEIASIEHGRKHVHITLTNGRKVYTSATLSDKRRGNLELIQDLRRIWNEGSKNNAAHNT